MEIRAVAGCYQSFWSARGDFSGGSFTGAPSLASLRLWGNPRFLGRRGARNGVLVLKCSSAAGREADAGRWALFSLAHCSWFSGFFVVILLFLLSCCVTSSLTLIARLGFSLQ
jgi:hypothetical protein